MSVVSLSGVSRSFGKAKSLRRALSGVSLDIGPGEWIALLGPNGAGKSTLMRLITGELAADEGEVTIGLDEPRAELGVVFQKPALDRQLTVQENLDLAGALYGMSSQSRRTKIDELAKALGFNDRLPDRVRTLSGGLARRVDLARALMHEPKLLMLDEPTSGLDPETSNTINELIIRLEHTVGATSIVNTHDMHSVLAIADRVGFIHDGRMHWTGTIAELHACTDSALCDFVRANEYQIG